MEEPKENIKSSIDSESLAIATEPLKELYYYDYEKIDEEFNLKSKFDYKDEFVFLLSKHFYSKKVPFEFAKAVIDEIISDDKEKDRRIKYLNHVYVQPLSEKELRKISQSLNFRDFIETLAMLQNIEALDKIQSIDLDRSKINSIYTTVLTLGYFDSILGTSIWKPLAVAPIFHSGNSEAYFVNDPQNRVSPYGIYLLKRNGIKVGMRYIFRFYMDNVKIDWNDNPQEVKYTISFKDSDNNFNFTISKASLEDIVKTVNNHVFGVGNAEMLLNAISSLIPFLINNENPFPLEQGVDQRNLNINS